jgi:hypothetical protein
MSSRSSVAQPSQATPTIASILQTFAHHPALVFRDQDLGADELATSGRVFWRPS